MTSFANEACDQVSIRSRLPVLPEEVVDNMEANNIKDYFSRPRLLNSLIYNATIHGTIGSWNLSNTDTQARMYNFSRVLGARGWRAKFVFRIQVTATPFQAGRLRLYLDPLNSQSASDRIRYLSVTTMSQLPGVDLDITESTSAILTVPFIHPASYFPVLNVGVPDSALSLGTVHLAAYTPVVLAAGVLPPVVAVWHWLEDFELIGATAGSIVSQSGKFKSEDRAIPGNLSNVLAAGANLITWAKDVPLISSVAQPTAWFLRQTAKIASSYGWSKPRVITPPGRMMNTYNTYQHNVDGTDAVLTLGAMAENAVAPLSGFAGTDVDEMSFDFLKSIYTAVSTPTLSTSQPINTLIFSTPLTPMAMWYNGQSKLTTTLPAAGTGFYPTPLFAIANNFRHFRGGFKFRIKMAKTKFHSGRLILGYIPVETSATKYVPAEPSLMNYKSIVWDLREQNVIEFECPYVSPTPYVSRLKSYGTFFIIVLEPLVAPDTVASTVQLVVEVAGSTDMEFAVPTPLDSFIAPNNTLLVAQSGTFEPMSVDSNPTASLYCVGEKINSAKQMMNRACIFTTANTSTFINVDNGIENPIYVPSAAAPTSITIPDTTLWFYYTSFYALRRGGLNFDVISMSSNSTISAFLKGPADDLSTMPIITESRTALHFNLPYYSIVSRTPNFPDAGIYYENKEFATIAFSSVGAGSRYLVYKRAADDYQVGYFSGIPAFTVQFIVPPVATAAASYLTTAHVT